MKIRTDFVTNSSSSSFIFGKPGDSTVTKESMNNKIKEISAKLAESNKLILEEVRKNIELNALYNEWIATNEKYNTADDHNRTRLIRNARLIANYIAKKPEFKQIINDVFSKTVYDEVGEDAESIVRSADLLLFDESYNRMLNSISIDGLPIADLTHPDGEDISDEGLRMIYKELGYGKSDALTEEELDMEDDNEQRKILNERLRQTIVTECGTLLYHCYDHTELPSSLYNWLCNNCEFYACQ